MRIWVILFLASSCAQNVDEARTAGALSAGPCAQGQIFGNAQHTGIQTCPGVSSMSVRAQIETDPDAQQEHDDRGYYSVQVGAVVTSGPNAYVPSKRGYTDLFDPGAQTWSVTGWTWLAGELVRTWSHDTAWKPVDSVDVGFTNLNEQIFQPVLVTGDTAAALYVPGRSGTLERLDPATGTVSALIDPLAGTQFSGDPNAFVMSALTAGSGSIWYTVAAVSPQGLSVPPRGSWLVRVTADNKTTITPWASIATRGIPQTTDMCQYSFDQAGQGTQRPLPPTPFAPTPMFRCGGQRPPVNAAPAVSADGRTVIVVSSDNNAITHLYLIAVDTTTMRPLRASAFQGHLHDGCGVLIPYGTGPSDCRAGTPRGNDPNFNAPETITYAGPVANAPVIAPDESVYFGSIGFDGYDDNRGHMFHFDSVGKFLETYTYAFAATPAIFRHGSTWSLVMDDSSTSDGTDQGGAFRVSRFSPSFAHEATLTVQNDPDVEANDTLDGQGALDAIGNFYSLSASGVVRKISPTGALLETLKLDGPVGEAQASPLSWGVDDAGHPVLYAPLFGVVWVIGAGVQAPSAGSPRGVATGTRRGAATGARPTPPDFALAARVTPDPGICQDDRDNCPGGHPITLRQRTDNEGRAVTSSHGWSIISTPEISCTSGIPNVCNGTFRLTATQDVQTTCVSDGAQLSSCSSMLCTHAPNCDSCSTSCTGL